MLPETGKYFKCSNYEVRNHLVGPVPGATVLEYDLWTPYAKAKAVGWTIPVPYIAALELAKKVRRNPPIWAKDGNGLVMQSEQATTLVDFCSNWGLLGVLPSQASEICLAERDRRYVKWRGHWTEILRQASGTSSIDYIDWEEAMWMAPAQGAAGLAGNPLQLAGNFDSSFAVWDQYQDEPIEVLGGCFFPGLPISEYPLPGSQPFWQMYNEPVYLIATMLLRFLISVEVLSGISGPASLADRRIALQFLRILAAEDHADTAICGDDYRDEHATPGLLAAFAAMFLRDWKSKRRVVHCETCGTTFVTSDTRVKFCSERCRKTMLMRRYRKSKRPGDATE